MQTALTLSSIGKRFLPFAIVACIVAFALHACTSSTDYNTPRVITNAASSGGTGTTTLPGMTGTTTPTITSFIPTSAGPGNRVIIDGTNFTGATAVLFGGIAAASFVVISPTQIIAVVGAEGATGNISVTTLGGTAILTGFTFKGQ